MFTHDLGDNAYLKAFGFEDAEALFELTDRNRDHLRRWLPWVDKTKSAADSRGFIAHVLGRQAANDGMQAGIWHGKDIAGVIGHNKVDHGNHTAAIGYWLGESFEGKGLMTKACRALLDYSFGPMGIHRIEIRCGVENKKSRGIPERLGCKLEGILRHGELLATGYHDIALYSMLREEWQA